LFPAKFAVEIRLALSHLAFDEIDDLLRLSDRVLLCLSADDRVRTIKENHGRGDALAFRVGNHLRLPIFIDVRHSGIRRS